MTGISIKMFKVLLLVFILFMVISEGQKYKIIRKASGDRFELPSPPCATGWRQKCKDMNGEATGTNCRCKCTKGSNNVFGYFNKSWKCTSNREVRSVTHSGKKICLFIKIKIGIETVRKVNV